MYAVFVASQALLAAEDCPDIPEEQVCYRRQAQDLSCNGIEVTAEQSIDLADPLCRSTTDSSGVPWPSADYGVEHGSPGCAYLVGAYDMDNDGLISANIAIPPSGVPDMVISSTVTTARARPATISGTQTATMSATPVTSAPAHLTHSR